MKKLTAKHPSVVRAILALGVVLTAYQPIRICAEDAARVTAMPAELAYEPGPADNPLKGLVPYQGPYEGRFPTSMEFNYLPFSAFVQGPGRYDWAALDELLDDVASRGRQTVVRVFLEYPGKKNVIPRFLVDGGLKVHRYVNTNTHPLPPAKIETPDYEDPNLRTAMTEFVAAWGQRYDGDPRLAYITAGLLGTWGEWHTYPKSEYWASKKVQREIYDAYAKAFTKTPILLRYPAGPDNYAYADSSPYPFGYHDDSFAHSTLPTGREEDDWFFLPTMQAGGLTERWQTAPIGGEIRPEVWGCCFDDPPCTEPSQSFDECRDRLHVTWLMDTGLNSSKPVAPDRYERALASVRKMGYDIEIASVQCKESPDSIRVSVVMRNRGIAPFYHHGWNASLSLQSTSSLSQRNEKPTRIATDWSPRMILPGEQKTFTHVIDTRGLDPGRHALRIAIPNPMPGGKPLRFANRACDPETGTLVIATLDAKG